MKRPLIILGAIVVLLLSVSSIYGQDTRKEPSRTKEKNAGDVVVRVGYVEFLGLTHTDKNGKPAGLVNEITMKTLEHAGIKYTIASYPAGRLFDDLSKGRLDLFNGLHTIPSFKNTTIHSSVNLFPLEMRIYFIGDKKIINFKEELSNRSIVMTRGYSYHDWGTWIRDKNNKVIFYETDTHDASFQMLKKGRVDYLLTYKYIDDACLKNMSIPNLRFNAPSSVYGLYCTFNLNKNMPHADKILRKLEDSYQQLINEGKLKQYN